MRSSDGASFSEWSRLFDLNTESDAIPPTVPEWADSNEFISDGDTFIATWKPIDRELEQNKDFARYEIELTDGTKTVVIHTTNTSYTLTFDANRTIFGTAAAVVTARVRSRDQVGNVSAYSDTRTATNPKPSTPASMVVTELYDSIKIDWSPVDDWDLAGYRVQVSTTSATAGFITIYNGPSATYTHETTQFLTDHWYRVYAVDKFGTVSDSLTSSAKRPKSTFSSSDTTPPANATGLNGVGGFDAASGLGYIDISWTASSTPDDVSVYRIRYSKESGMWEYREVPDDATAYRLKDLLADANYTVQIQAVDAVGNASAWLTTSTSPVKAGKDTVTPSKPMAPIVATNALQAQVNISGQKDGGGAMESNVSYYNVYADSGSSTFVPSNSTLIGRVEQGVVMIETFNIPANGNGIQAQNWHFKVIAVSRAGLSSPASEAWSTSVSLIKNANIAEATITSAKIADLKADKITAGSGIINDLLIKAGLTVGDATTSGYIRSNEYAASGGSSGYYLTKDNLIIRSGEIEAKAIKLQAGSQNLVPAEFSDFEYPISFYPGKFSAPGTISEVSVWAKKFGAQSFATFWGAKAEDTVITMAQNPSTYNIPVEAGKEYIISAYAFRRGSVPTNVTMFVKLSNGTEVNLGATATRTDAAYSPDGSAAERLSGVTGVIPTGVTALHIGFRSTTQSALAGFNIDGLQVEERISLATTPSPWTAPASTTINAYGITTGALQSTAPALDDSGAVIPNMPAWSINTQGGAVLGDVLVRGRMIMGVSSESQTSILKSYNFAPGTSGWAVKSNGSSEFNDIFIRAQGEVVGDFIVSTGTIKAGTGLPRIEIANSGIKGYRDRGSRVEVYDLGNGGNQGVDSVSVVSHQSGDNGAFIKDGRLRFQQSDGTLVGIDLVDTAIPKLRKATLVSPQTIHINSSTAYASRIIVEDAFGESTPKIYSVSMYGHMQSSTFESGTIVLKVISDGSALKHYFLTRKTGALATSVIRILGLSGTNNLAVVGSLDITAVSGLSNVIEFSMDSAGNYYILTSPNAINVDGTRSQINNASIGNTTLHKLNSAGAIQWSTPMLGKFSALGSEGGAKISVVSDTSFRVVNSSTGAILDTFAYIAESGAAPPAQLFHVDGQSYFETIDNAASSYAIISRRLFSMSSTQSLRATGDVLSAPVLEISADANIGHADIVQANVARLKVQQFESDSVSIKELTTNLLPYGRRTRTNSAQNIGHNAWTAIALTTGEALTGGMEWDSGNNCFVVRRDGLYVIDGAIRWVSNGTGARGAAVFVNGNAKASTLIPALASATGCSSMVGTTLRLEDGDTVALRGYQGSGGALDAMSTAAEYTYMTIAYVGS